MATEFYYAIGLVFLFLFLKFRHRFYMYLILNRGTVLFKDEVGAKVFVDHEYGLSAKPDRVVEFRNKKYVLEYKSRTKGIFKKDIIQALIGALSCWDRYNGLNGVIVYNGSYQYKIVKIRTKSKVFARIKKHVLNAQKIKSGKLVKCKVVAGKCNVCPYKKSCEWAR